MAKQYFSVGNINQGVHASTLLTVSTTYFSVVSIVISLKCRIFEIQVGDQPDVIHFLVEAGANVDSYNDSCCTPLGVALMRYVCAGHDVPPSVMLQALLPPPSPQAPRNVSKLISSSLLVTKLQTSC